MKRLLFVITTSDYGGTETFLEELVLRLDRSRFAPTVCSLCPPGRIAQSIASSGVPLVSLSMSAAARVPEMIAAVFRLARLIDRHSIDLTHSLLYRANVLCALGARVARRRSIVVSGQRSLTPMTGRSAGLAARWTRRLGHRIVAVSDAVRDELIRTERLDPQRITVIGNGVDVERFRCRPADGMRARLGLSPGSVVVGGVGRLSPEKGFDLLIEAVGLARQRGCDLELALIGDGPERRALEHLAVQRGVGERVKFLGRRSNLEQLYPALDIFALPSREEGSPNALLEAMACGRAAIASTVGGVPEIVEPGRSGLLMQPESVPELEAALLRLAGDAALRAELGTRARETVEQRFALSRMVELHERLYLSLLDPAT